MNFNIQERGRYKEYYYSDSKEKIYREPLTDKKIKEAIDKINERIKDETNLTKYKERLEELKKDSKVSNYIELQKNNDKTPKQLEQTLKLESNKKVQEYVILNNRIENAEKYHKRIISNFM